MINLLLILAMFAHVLLVIFILIKMRKVRVQAYKDKQVTLEEIAVNHQAWPESVRKVQNNYASQFELPVLFHVACLLALVLDLNSPIFVGLAWLFVISRYGHSYIHTGSNSIPHRFKVFLVGFVAIIAQWLFIVIQMALNV